MKVGIVTLIGNNNYGNRLQNYALSKVINNLGYRSYTIRIVGYDEGKKSFAKYIRYKYLFALKQCFMNGLVRTYKFRKFNKNILFYKNELSSIANTDKINDDFDCFVVGSDQVWNYKMASPVSVYFLEWADRNKRISYAASFGFDKVPREKSEEYRKLINGMRTISVREKTGSEIIKKITGRMDAKVLVDPTLLVQVDDWIALSKEPVKFKCLDGKKYILGFFLGGEEDAWKSEIQKIAEEHNYKIINLLDRKSLFYDSSPSEFLYLVQHAELVCTDSFHASVFAFIFDRPFVVFKRRGCGDYMYSRLQNLISTFRLRNREFSGEILRENLLVDYTEGKKILEKEREKSLKFLQDALEGCSD